MPNTGNYAEVVQDWKQILSATEEHADKMGDVTAEREELQEILVKAGDAKTRQESHTAARQASTQELKELLLAGADVAMKLRFAAKLKLGPRNEQLVQFGARPLRARKPKPKPIDPPPEQHPAE